MNETNYEKAGIADSVKLNNSAEREPTSELRYRRLFESSRDGILILDATTRKIIDVNPFMIDLLGYSREEFLGKELWELGLLRDQEASQAAFTELQESGYIRYGDLRLETDLGRRCEVEFISNVYDEGDRPVIQCNIRDITGRMAAESRLERLADNLEETAEDYRRVLDNSLDVICQIDKVGQFIKISPAAQRVWGYEPEELIGTMYWDMVHPDDQVKTRYAAGNTLAGKPTSTFENRTIRKDGAVAYMMWSGSWSESHQMMYCVARDVSEIRLAETALEESETNYRTLIESLPAIVCLSQPFQPYASIFISPNAEAFGYSIEEWTGRPDMWISLIHEDDRERVLLEVAEAMESGTETDLEYRMVTPDGKIHWMCDKGILIPDPEGIVNGWQRVLTDVTKSTLAEEKSRRERQAIEATLRKSEARLRAIFDNSTECMKLVSRKGELLDMNAAGLAMIEADSLDQVRGSNIYGVIIPEHRDDFMSLSQRVFKGESGTLEYDIIGLDGTKRTLDTQASPIRNDRGEVEAVLSITRDITRRKHAERALQVAVNDLQLYVAGYERILDNSLDVICSMDEEGRFAAVSKASRRIWGYEPSELIGTLYMDLVHPDDHAITIQAATDIIAGHPVTTFENRYLHKDGRVIPVVWSAKWLESDMTMFCVARDVTAMKFAEEGLVHSEQRYRDLVENAYDMIYTRDMDGNFTSVNTAGGKLTGYSREEFLQMNLSQIVVPEDLGRAKELIARQLTGIEGTTCEMGFLAKDGRRLTLEVNTTLIYRDGTAVGVQGIARDVTERKKNEETLQLLETSVSRLNDIVLITEAEPINEPGPRIVFVNDAFVRRTGFSREEVIGKTPRILQGAKTQRDVLDRIHAALKSWQPVREEIINYTKSGEEFWLELDIVPVADTQGWFTHWVAIERDITERKKAEEANSRLVAMLESSPDFAGYADAKTSQILYINKGGRKLLGLAEDEDVTKLRVSDMHSARTLEILRDTSVPTVMREGAWSGECSFLHRDGRELPGLMAMVAFKSSAGEVEIISMMSHDITERKFAEDALRRQNALTRIAGHLTQTGGWAVEVPDNRITWSAEASAILEFPPDKILPLTDILALYPEPGRSKIIAAMRSTAQDGTPFDIELEIRTATQRLIWVRVCGEADRKADGTITRVQGAFQDISDRKGTEDQLRQAQKMEAVGQMAGGIAHDFNNMLTAINGYSDLTLRRMKEDDPLRRNIEEIKKAGERSAELTNQLLAFSRRQILKPEVVYLNRIITETSTLLERMIGEDVELITVLNPKTGKIKADPGQLSQIIMNLAVNARDAMPKGGTLTFETNNVFLDKEYTSRHVNVLPGAYVKLTVSDNGTGMDAEIKQHIFEPFFTTKPTGEGTGLGLAMVYGIVKQSSGHIMLYSEVGIGTTFTIYLPRVMEPLEEAEAVELSGALPTGTETILLVEDEEIVRILTRNILEMCGYTVLEAASGEDALAICVNNPGCIDLLMTDVVMPGMGGRELAEKVSVSWPRMLVLFTSGYTDDAVVRHGVIDSASSFIQKPFTTESLARKVRELFETSERL